MSKATEQKVKEKLKSIRDKTGTPFGLLLETLFLERFLVRISKSKYKDKLIFKGGMCLAQIIKLGRETRDIDFLLSQLDANKDSVQKILKEIAGIDAGDDFIFKDVSVRELPHEHKKYPGYRISIQGSLGQIKNKVSIDVGVGDVVRPNSQKIELMRTKDPLFENSIDLSAYPAEYIFSEKLEAILHLGDINGRMKDYFDCYRLMKEKKLDKKMLKTALNETFENRGTKLELIPDYTESLSGRWQSFLQQNNIDDLNLKELINELNSFLSTILK